MKLLPLAVYVSAVAATFSGYGSDVNIYDLTPLNFDKIVHKSNYTTIVEFYAPWCGYCQQLAPVYQKLGRLIHQDSKHAVHVAAVNCDKDYNKQLCSNHQVSGFPTIKVFRPQKFNYGSQGKIYNAASETYQGERQLKPMWRFLEGKIKNYVKKYPRLGEPLKEWISEVTPNDPRRKALVVTKSRNLSPMLKLLAIDFLNSWRFAMVTVDSNPSSMDFEVEGHALPISEGDKFPILLVWKPEGGWEKYTGKVSDSVAISKWLVKEGGINPSEGPLLKKEKKYYSKYRTGKASIDHDEL